jgi:hypothetical protein
MSSTQELALSKWLDASFKTEYEWGSPARGVLRSYFAQPVLFEQWTAGTNTPTIYRYKTDSGDYLDFRPDPRKYKEHNLIPANTDTVADALTYPRDMVLLAETTGNVWPLKLTDVNRPVASLLGVREGDIVSMCPEVIYYGAADRLQAVQTFTGSSKVVCPLGSGFGADVIGNFLSIEEGADAGVYRVTQRVNMYTLILDRTLKESTPPILDRGVGEIRQTTEAILTRVQGEGAFGLDVVTQGAWATVYSCFANPDGEYSQGSYRIIARNSNGAEITVEIPGGQTFPPGGESVYFVITAAPSTAPTRVDANSRTDRPGSSLHGLRPIRVYSEIMKSFPIVAVTTSSNQSLIGIGTTPPVGRYMPYRIYRENVRRINPTEMNNNQEGFLYYFDTEVTSLSPSPANNISRDGSYLMPKEETFLSLGYRHVVDDPSLTYSVKESGMVVIPKKILPVNSEDSEDSLLTLVGAPIQISYERADIVQQVQDFISSTEDRVTSANMLARHFLPTYVSYDANYVGGSSPGVVAKEIIAYIEGLSIETPINVSEVEHVIMNLGGDPETPTTVSITVHDWDRKVWVEFSQDSLGGIKTKVPYNGTPRVSYFVPGTDVSGQAIPEPGERIKLTQK